MDNELRYFLEQAPTSVKELARLTGKSTSTIYKSIKHPDVQETSVKDGPRLYFIKPETSAQATGSTAEPPQPVPTQPQPDIAPAPSKRGRKGTAAGQKLWPVVGGEKLNPEDMLLFENPRRKNSNGYRSLQIIIDNPGISTEDYLAQGGRLNDLRWDLAHGNVKAEQPQ